MNAASLKEVQQREKERDKERYLVCTLNHVIFTNSLKMTLTWLFLSLLFNESFIKCGRKQSCVAGFSEADYFIIFNFFKNLGLTLLQHPELTLISVPVLTAHVSL